jgi:hypothetical protein
LNSYLSVIVSKIFSELLDYKANISAIRQHWPVLLRKVEKAARNDGGVVKSRFAAHVLTCHVVAARPDETVDKLEQFTDHRMVAELAGLNTFRGAFLILKISARPRWHHMQT